MQCINTACVTAVMRVNTVCVTAVTRVNTVCVTAVTRVNTVCVTAVIRRTEHDCDGEGTAHGRERQPAHLLPAPVQRLAEGEPRVLVPCRGRSGN